MINMFIMNGMYLSFCIFYVLPRASYGYIQCGFIPSAVWRFSNFYFPVFLDLGSLTRETYKTSYIFGFISGIVGRHVEGCQAPGYAWQLYIYISPFWHLYVHWYVCEYVYTSIHLSVHPWEIWGGHLSVCQASLCLSVHQFVCKAIHCLSKTL